MAVAVRDIVELVGPDRAAGLGLGQLLGKPARDLDVVVRVRIGHGGYLYEFGTAQPQHVLLFLALRVRDHDYGAEAERVTHKREANAGISSSALDDDTAAAQPAALHRILDDEQR